MPGININGCLPEYIKSIEEADVEIGKFLEKMKRDGLYKDTHFMFLTDHGGIEYGHGGVSTNEMIVPWGDHRSRNTQRVQDHGTQ